MDSPGSYTPPPGGPPPGAPPDNNMVLAVISIFCCWPLAIPAIINATQVQSKWAMGDQAGAVAAAAQARKWAMIAIIGGVVATVLFVICYFGGLLTIVGLEGAATTP